MKKRHHKSHLHSKKVPDLQVMHHQYATLDLDALLQEMSAPPGARDENRIAEIVIPLAAKMAVVRARAYRDHPNAPHLDEESFFDEAMEAVYNVIRRATLLPECPPKKCLGLFQTAIKNSFAALYRKENSIMRRNPESHADLSTLQLSYTAHFDPEAAGEIQAEMRKKIKCLFEPDTQTYKVAMAAITYLPQGIDKKEIAGKLGISTSLFSAILNTARRRICDEYPELQSDLFKLLENAYEPGNRQRSIYL